MSNRVDHAVDKISELEDKAASLEYPDSFKEKKITNHDQNIKELWDKIKRTNLSIIGINEGYERQANGMKNLFREISTEKIPNLGNKMDIHIQDTFKTSNR